MAEFLVVIIIAIAVIPAKDWPTVAKWLARCVKWVRQLIWKITDATEQIKEQVERELPIDEIMKNANLTEAFSNPVKPVKKKAKKK